MIKDPENENEYGRYEYYRLGDTPIRLVFSTEDNIIGTNGLNVETGELVIGSYIREIDNNPDIEEITEEQFYSLCEDLIRRKT